MAVQRLELQNLNYNDTSIAENYVIIPVDTTPKPLKIPAEVDEVIKIYAGEQINFICQSAANEAEGLIPNPESSGQSIIDQINSMSGVGPASEETLLRID